MLTPASTEGVQQLVDLAQAEMDRGIGFDDAALNAVAYSPQPHEIDFVRQESIFHRQVSDDVVAWLRELGLWEAHSPVRIPPNPELGMLARVCVPVHLDHRLVGFLWLIETPTRLDEREVRIAESFAEKIAGALSHEQAIAERESAREAEAVESLVRGEPLRRLARLRLAGLVEVFVAVVVLPEVAVAEAREAAEQELADAVEGLRRREAWRGILARIADGRGTVVLGGPSGIDAMVLRELEALGRNFSRGPIFVGVSRGHHDHGELKTAFEEACRSAEAASAEPAERCVSWDSLGADRTILRLLGGRRTGPLVPEGLTRLIESEGGDELLVLLAAYLEAGCDKKATASTFSIHRSTLYQRLEKVEQISEMDLASGDDRLNLQLGLRLLHWEGLSKAVP